MEMETHVCFFVITEAGALHWGMQLAELGDREKNGTGGARIIVVLIRVLWRRRQDTRQGRRRQGGARNLISERNWETCSSFFVTRFSTRLPTFSFRSSACHQGWVCPNAAISWATFSDWFLDNDFMCPNKRSSKTPNFSDYFPDVSMIFSMCFVQFLKHRAWAISPSQDFIICAALVVLLFGPRSVEIAMIGLWMLAQYGT